MLPGIVGVVQANEALKILVGYGEPLTGRLLMFDAMQTSFRTLKLRRDPECATCGAHAEAWQAWEEGQAGKSRGPAKEAVAVRMDSLPAAGQSAAAPAAEPASANGANGAHDADAAHANGAKAKEGKTKDKAKHKAGKAATSSV